MTHPAVVVRWKRGKVSEKMHQSLQAVHKSPDLKQENHAGRSRRCCCCLAQGKINVDHHAKTRSGLTLRKHSKPLSPKFCFYLTDRLSTRNEEMSKTYNMFRKSTERAVTNSTSVAPPNKYCPPMYISTCPLHTISGCGKERRILIGPW